MIKLKELLDVVETHQNKPKEIIKEAVSSYKGVFDYDPNDPSKACRSFEVLFDDADCGYSESWDSYGWNDDKNWQKAVDEFHKEMFKIVDEYVKAQKNALKFEPKKNKIFKKWRKTDGSRAGD